MTDTVSVFIILDRLGRGVAEALFIPSLEALLLGTVVWLVLKLDMGHAPRIRHILWVLVILKPLLSLILPWRGPFPVPILSANISTEGAVSSGYTGAWHLWLADHLYAVLAVIWAAAVAAGVVWTLMNAWILFRRTRQTMPVSVPWAQALFARCLSIAGVTRPIQLRMSDEFASPTLVAIGTPVVVIPTWCLIRLSPQEIKQVFLHELIHYTRHDHLTLFLVQLAKICFFFHPLIWYAGRRIGVEAERACDVAVVTVSPKPQSYAASLLKVAEGALRTRWHGVLELARSASLTAMRIKDVLNGFDVHRLAMTPRSAFLLVAFGAGSLLPFFHIRAPRFVPNISASAQYMPLSPDGSVATVALMPSSRSAPVEPGHSSVTLGNLTQQDEPSARAFRRPSLSNPQPAGRPYAKTPFTTALVKSGPSEPVIRHAAHTPELNASMLGLPSHALSNGGQPIGTAQWEPGQIEVQGIGHTPIQQGLSRMMSLRAGYFVTKAHEFGGVLSVFGPGGEFERAGGQEDANAHTSLSERSSVATRRIAFASSSVLNDMSSSNALPQDAEGEEPSNQTVRIGGFYRYNLAGFSKILVPFLGVGAGVEVRSGRNPVLVDGGGGVRCFFSKHAALIVQIDYVKDVEFTTRSRMDASLGFSTIF